MSRSAVLKLKPESCVPAEVGPFEVQAAAASLFSTLVAALLQSLMPNAALHFRQAEESTPLRSNDVLLTHEPTNRSLIVFGSPPDRALVAGCLALGTNSMISIDASRDELIAAVNSLVTGPAFVSTGVVHALARSPESASAGVSLTSRELEIVGYVVEGLSNREMAERLCLSPNTIRAHLQSASAKLGVNSRTRLAAQARTLGIA